MNIKKNTIDYCIACNGNDIRPIKPATITVQLVDNWDWKDVYLCLKHAKELRDNLVKALEE